MFVLLSNLSSLTLNPVYLKWTPNVVAIHVHCRKHNIKQTVVDFFGFCGIPILASFLD